MAVPGCRVASSRPPGPLGFHGPSALRVRSPRPPVRKGSADRRRPTVELDGSDVEFNKLVPAGLAPHDAETASACVAASRRLKAAGHRLSTGKPGRRPADATRRPQTLFSEVQFRYLSGLLEGIG